MARKPGPGQCVHCLSHVQKRNWDHVFPVSWYPDSTPQNIEKWKIPTCKPCNDAYGVIEEELGQVLSLCVEPDTIEFKGVYQRLLRAFDPSQGRNDKDRKIRARKRERILKEMLRGDQIPSEGIYPGLGERWNRPRTQQRALLVPAKHIERLGMKIVRGLAYLEDGKLIGNDFEIEHHPIVESGSKLFEEALAKFGQRLSRGPGIVVSRAVTNEDGVSSIYKIVIWGEFVLYLTVLAKAGAESA